MATIVINNVKIENIRIDTLESTKDKYNMYLITKKDYVQE